MTRFSLDRRDRKLLGVAARIGDRFAVEPTFVRVGFVALALLASWKLALIAYVTAAIWLRVGPRRASRRSDFERMADVGARRPSVHAMRTGLDPADRQMMAVDHYLASSNEALAREIDALREEK